MCLALSLECLEDVAALRLPVALIACPVRVRVSRLVDALLESDALPYALPESDALPDAPLGSTQRLMLWSMLDALPDSRPLYRSAVGHVDNVALLAECNGAVRWRVLSMLRRPGVRQLMLQH